MLFTRDHLIRPPHPRRRAADALLDEILETIGHIPIREEFIPQTKDEWIFGTYDESESIVLNIPLARVRFFLYESLRAARRHWSTRATLARSTQLLKQLRDDQIIAFSEKILAANAGRREPSPTGVADDVILDLQHSRRAADRLLAELLARLNTVPIREEHIPSRENRWDFTRQNPDGSISLDTPFARVGLFFHESIHAHRLDWSEQAVCSRTGSMLHALTDEEVCVFSERIQAATAGRRRG